MKADRQILRNQLRAQRRQLEPVIRKQAAEQIVEKIKQASFFQQAQCMGVYSADEGEIDLSLLIELAKSQGKHCYLPVIQPANQLVFLPHHFPKVKNRFGILEPDRHYDPLAIKTIEALDCIFIPLVAFDRMGHRLGRGGGYYDCALSVVSQSKHPLRVGVAYAFQEVSCLITEQWDISLHCVVTEQACLYIED